MPRAKTVCRKPGCTVVIVSPPFCDEHEREAEKARGLSSERGYGVEHRRARKSASRQKNKVCWRCGEKITPDEEWDLGHDDAGNLKGPEHRRRCNRRAAGLKAHGKPWTKG